jgi:hypothetical protein
MALTAAARATAILEAIDAKIAGGAVKSLSFPDGRNIVDMTLEELRKEYAYWKSVANSEADTTNGGLRVCKLTQKGMN